MVDRSVISKHLKNIYISRELEEISTCADFAQVQKEGERNNSTNLTCYIMQARLAMLLRWPLPKRNMPRLAKFKTVISFQILTNCCLNLASNPR